MQANTGIGDRGFAAVEEDGWLENGDDSSWDRGDDREISARNRGRGSNQGGGLPGILGGDARPGITNLVSPANNPQSVRREIHNPEPIRPGAAGQVTCGCRWWGALAGSLDLRSSGVRNWEGGALLRVLLAVRETSGGPKAPEKKGCHLHLRNGPTAFDTESL